MDDSLIGEWVRGRFRYGGGICKCGFLRLDCVWYYGEERKVKVVNMYV